ncbi:MAG: divalent-cation tolerance protein CutA [Timaviella obliquedivisa GSE-PSE-MK23-08B]|nr:divalent-cation tolerance protein CutA [Timaviella obliquedivisa GSE-PSE-MK23-08B]
MQDLEQANLKQNSLKQYGLVLVTASSQSEGEAIAQALLQFKLAACVSLMPIHSLYTWNGKVHNEAEWQLMIKTDLRNFSQLEAKVRELHSYEVPEIIALPIDLGSSPYLSWISEQMIQG